MSCLTVVLGVDHDGVGHHERGEFLSHGFVIAVMPCVPQHRAAFNREPDSGAVEGVLDDLVGQRFTDAVPARQGAVGAAAAGALLFGERLTWVELGGIALVLAGIVTLKLAPSWEPR